MEKLHLVLDWDGVVWDSGAYKHDLGERLAKFTDKDFDELYAASFDRNGFNDKLLARQIVRPDIDLRHALDIVDSRLGDYVYPDAKDFIYNFKKRQLGRISILTAGNPDFQLSKIDSSGLATFFSDIYVVPNNREHVAEVKTGFLSSLRYDEEPLVFIDDNLSTIRLASMEHGHNSSITPVYLNRSDEFFDVLPSVIASWQPRLDLDKLTELTKRVD